MKLERKTINNIDFWLEKGYQLPNYDIDKMIARTKATPEWIHFGAGNIFRSFPALLEQELLEKKYSDTGIIVIEGFDYEIIEKIYKPYDNLGILVTLNSNGTCEKKVIASVAEALPMGRQFGPELEKIKKIFRADSLRLASFTITEKGYNLQDSRGKYFEEVERDIKNGPEKAGSYMGMISALLYDRYKAGKKPLAMVCMDNFSHNGERLERAVLTFAEGWSENCLCDPGFTDYIKEKKLVSFPWSMIDKITPRPDGTVEEMIREDGIEGARVIVTGKNTHISSFINSEKPQYLVIEDNFPNGRPALDKAGVYFADRDTVNKAERMKVCTCLNPLHTALAIFGCLLGYTKISDEMKDPILVKLVRDMGYNEGLPVVINPGIISPKTFINEVIEERIPNPFLPDTPQRIATDTSQKLSVRFGETIKAYMEEPDKEPSKLKLIPLVLAGWFRYLMGVDDKGNKFETSPDPLSEMLNSHLKGLKLGSVNISSADMAIGPILENREIFGVDMKKAGLYYRIEDIFVEMTQGIGAVEQTLGKYVYEK